MYKQNAHPRMQNKAKNVNKCKCKMKKIASAQAQGEQMWKGYSEQKYKHINACWPTQVKMCIVRENRIACSHLLS